MAAQIGEWCKKAGTDVSVEYLQASASVSVCMRSDDCRCSTHFSSFSTTESRIQQALRKTIRGGTHSRQYLTSCESQSALRQSPSLHEESWRLFQKLEVQNWNFYGCNRFTFSAGSKSSSEFVLTQFVRLLHKRKVLERVFGDRIQSDDRDAAAVAWSQWISERESVPARHRHLRPAHSQTGQCSQTVNIHSPSHLGLGHIFVFTNIFNGF